MVIDDTDVIARYQDYFEKLWFDKYSAQRTRTLYKKAKKNLPDALNPNIKPESRTININTASKAKLVKVLNISEPLAWKIIALRNELGGFKEPHDLTQLLEITNLEWKEWGGRGILFSVR